jgi:hypothetical protein
MGETRGSEFGRRLSRRAASIILAIGAGAPVWSGCSSEEQPGVSGAGRGGSAGAGVAAGSGGDEAGNSGAGGSGGADAGESGAGGSGGAAGSPIVRMCHVDCIARRYCEDGTVYRVSRRVGPEFPCGTTPPPLECPALPIEECEYGCDESGLECAGSSGQGGAGAGGQGGDGGHSGDGGATNGGVGGDG